MSNYKYFAGRYYVAEFIVMILTITAFVFGFIMCLTLVKI